MVPAEALDSPTALRVGLELERLRRWSGAKVTDCSILPCKCHPFSSHTGRALSYSRLKLRVPQNFRILRGLSKLHKELCRHQGEDVSFQSSSPQKSTVSPQAMFPSSKL